MFPLAALGALIGLFIADARAGGLSGGEGFVVGFVIVVLIMVAVSATFVLAEENRSSDRGYRAVILRGRGSQALMVVMALVVAATILVLVL